MVLIECEVITSETIPCWRQLGCKLAELQKGSNMQLYYDKLVEVRTLIAEDIRFLRVSCGIVESTSQPEPEPEPEPERLPEKVADNTHRGPGYG